MGNREEILGDLTWLTAPGFFSPVAWIKMPGSKDFAETCQGLLEDTEGASLEVRRSQAKLSGKRTLFLISLESPKTDTDGASSA